MLKPLIFILLIVSIIALMLNFNFFSNTNVPINKTIVLTETKSKPLKESIIEISKISKETKTQENNLSMELQTLLKKANTLFQKNKDDMAIEVYALIIKRSKNSLDEKILKIFAQACFQKAKIHYIYPNNDIDLSIEVFDTLLEKIEHSQVKDLLLIYMRAKLDQAHLISKDEVFSSYDELIEKFEKDKEQRFTKEIEELLFEKSFALMGINDEEAMEALDQIISKYADKTKLPPNVQNSILNNIELSIITNNDEDKYIDLAEEYMTNSPDVKPLVSMLKIIKNAQDIEQSEALEIWKTEHSTYTFPDWTFSELRNWVNKMETPETQNRLRQYLDIFEKQKYDRAYNTTSGVTHTYSEEESY